MMSRRPHLTSLMAGAGIALITCVALGQKPAAPRPSLEYRIIEDVQAEDLNKLADQGWEYAGYLGQGVKGDGNDETLWRRPQK